MTPVLGRRRCWDCCHCMKWTPTPGNLWIGRCGWEEATDFREYIWLERDTCGYFKMTKNLTPLESYVEQVGSK